MNTMKKSLIIGSACADVIINLVHLPVTCEDVNIRSQKLSIGGCAFNVSEILRLFEVPYIPFFPVGSGIYADFVRSQFAARGIVSPIPSPQMENGCCYCFVEDGGERTFTALHGAEYLFQPQWFDLLDPSQISQVYICGLEIEEKTGCHIVSFLEQHEDLQIFFAPGPRLHHIDVSLCERIFALHPILHLNEEEALHFYDSSTRLVRSDGAVASDSGSQTSSDFTFDSPALLRSAAFLYEKTGNTVIITLGARGACFYDGTSLTHVPGVPSKVVDTIGAGDSHIGTVMACLQKGSSMKDAIAMANRVSARVVSVSGAGLTKEEFDMAESQ